MPTLRSPGRPRKDPDQLRDQHVSVNVTPSEKELIRQEARRCGTSMTEVVEKHAIEQVVQQGRQLPKPEVLLWLQERLSEITKKRNGALRFALNRLVIRMRRMDQEVEERRHERKRLRERAKEEPIDAVIPMRVSEKQKAWLEKKSDEQDTSVSGLLRFACLKGIEETEDFGRTRDWLQDWSDQINQTNTEKLKDEELEEATMDLIGQIKRTMARKMYGVER